MADYRRKVSLEITSNSERIIRSCLNNYAGSSSGHPFRNYGNDVKIKVYDKCNVFIPYVYTQYDHRKVYETKTPYTGRPVGERTVFSAAGVDPWRLRLLTAGSFTKTSKTFTVPGSEHVETCIACSGHGTVTCSTCHGEKEMKCPHCSHGKVDCSACSNGKVRCSSCGGTGSIRTSHTESYIVSQTYHTGSVVPDTKWGTRTVYKNEPCHSCHDGYNTCSRCGGKGYNTCSHCGGSGTITCRTCNGRGIVTCSNCGGRGRNLHYIAVDQTLDTRYQQCLVHDSRLSRITELTGSLGRNSGKVIFEKRAERLGSNLVPEDSVISSQLDSFLSAHARETTSTNHILFQEAKVLQVDVWYIEYDYKGKRYYGAISDGKFYAGFSPITEYAEKVINKADKKVGGLGTVAARDLLEKAEQMKVYGKGNDLSRLRGYIEKHLNTLYNTGIDLVFWLLTLFGTPFLLQFYTNLNPVMGYMYFTNQPEWAGYDMLPIMQCMAFVVVLWYIRRNLKSQDHSEHRYKTVFGFLGAGMGVLLLSGLGVLAAMLLLNFFGFSVIITLAGTLVWKVLRFVLIAVIMVLMFAFWILKEIWKFFAWIWGLIF